MIAQRLTCTKSLMTILALAAFPTLALGSSPTPVNLGSAGNFSVLAKTGVQAGSGTVVVGNIGVAPAAASYITGFGLLMDGSSQFSTSSLVSGKIYAADYSPPTPAIMTTAIGDMQTAYSDAESRAPGVTELGAGDISGLTLVAGVYFWSSGVAVNSNLTLSGSATDVWIFQIAQTLTVAGAVHIQMSGGAIASNVFWQVAQGANLGTGSVFSGDILDQTAIVVGTGSVMNGKALAQTAVTVVGSTVTSVCAVITAPGQAHAYPSPAHGGVVNIVSTLNTPGRASVRIWNENGDLAATQAQSGPAGVMTIPVPVNQFAPGVYLYIVTINYDSGSVDKLPVQKFAVSK
jgi:hypothetical protein